MLHIILCLSKFEDTSKPFDWMTRQKSPLRNISRLQSYATIDDLSHGRNVIRNFYQTSLGNQLGLHRTLTAFKALRHKGNSSESLLKWPGKSEMTSSDFDSIPTCCFTRKQRKFSFRLGQFSNCLNSESGSLTFRSTARLGCTIDEQESFDRQNPGVSNRP